MLKSFQLAVLHLSQSATLCFLTRRLHMSITLLIGIEREMNLFFSCVSRCLPFPASLPACRLAGPCVKGGCCRTDCGNSRSASPVPYSLTRGAAINPSLLEPLPAHTSPQPTHSLPNNPRKQFHLDSGGGPLSPTPSIFPN